MAIAILFPRRSAPSWCSPGAMAADVTMSDHEMPGLPEKMEIEHVLAMKTWRGGVEKTRIMPILPCFTSTVLH